MRNVELYWFWSVHHSYGTAQMQGNVWMFSEHVQNMSKTCTRCVQNSHEMHPCKHKPCDKTAARLNSLPCPFCQMRDVFRALARCIRNAPGMCERCIPDTCKHYVAFKLYRMTWKRGHLDNSGIIIPGFLLVFNLLWNHHLFSDHAGTPSQVPD